MGVRTLGAIFGMVCACAADSSSDGGSDSSGGGSTSTTGASTTAPAETGPSSTTASTEADSSSSSSGAAEATTNVATDDGSSSSSGGPVGSPGCTTGEGLADGEHTFMLDGYDRRYILRLPQGYSNEQPWPLIFALHGNGGDTSYWDAQGGVRDIRAAFADEAIVVVVEAIDHQWRDYAADPATWPDRIELELTYFDTVLDEARNQLCIDDGNVFSMGFSGGGSFSGVLGCQREYIRAIAVGGSVIYFEPADCVASPAAWITIGEQETTPEREAYRDFFRDLAGCDATSTPGTPEGCVNYDGCNPETPVTFCSHPAGHEWPSIGTDATKAFFEQFYAAP
jgi:polyhydroxybutyrate depolymerase